MVAESVGLAPCSVSAILNDTAAAKVIPQGTKDRVFRVARELNYAPNFWARSLRTKRTRMVAAVARDFGSPAVARVVACVHSRLQQKGYLLALGAIDGDGRSLTVQFQQRGIEGVVAIDLAVPRDLELPVASVDLNLADDEAEDNRHRLSEVGQSAAEAVIWHIENQGSARRMAVRQKPSSGYFEVPPTFEAGAIVQSL